MNATESPPPKGRMTLGAVLLAIGLVLTLDRSGILGLEGLGRWWPLFLIGIGLVKARQPLEDGQRAVGVALLFLGSLAQVVSVLSVVSAWPLLMVTAGGFLLWRGIHSSAPAAGVSPPPASDLIEEVVLIGALKRSLPVMGFRGGYITAVMGGVELDLRKAAISGGPAHLDVVTFWGGIELKVPAGWTVEGRVLPLMGGFENKTHALDESGAQTLVVHGYAVMGAVVIAN